jgi:uncharacterized protein YraI
MSLKLTFAASIAALTMLAAGSAFAATVTTALNVRDEPGPHGDIIGVLEEGTEVVCTDMIGTWCELDDGEGYVYGKYLDFDDDDDDDDEDEDEDDDFGDDDDVDIDVDY